MLRRTTRQMKPSTISTARYIAHLVSTDLRYFEDRNFLKRWLSSVTFFNVLRWFLGPSQVNGYYSPRQNRIGKFNIYWTLSCMCQRIFALPSRTRSKIGFTYKGPVKDCNQIIWEKEHFFPLLCLSVGGTVASWLVRTLPERVVRVWALTADIVLWSWARH